MTGCLQSPSFPPVRMLLICLSLPDNSLNFHAIRQPLSLRALHHAISDVNLTGRNSFILTGLIIFCFRYHSSYIVFAELFSLQTLWNAS